MRKSKAVTLISGSLLISILLAASVLAVARVQNQHKQASEVLSSPPNFTGVFPGEDGVKLEKPVDVDMYCDTLYVLDAKTASIKTFSKDGKFIREVRIESDGVAQSYPTSMAIDSDEQTVYIAEAHNTRIKIIDLRGQPKGFLPNSANMLKKPIDVAYHQNKIYVADAGSQTIKVFNVKNKDLLVEFGDEGSGPGQFSFPTGIAISDVGDICVADSNNKRIQIFDSGGQIKEVIRKSPRGFFALPRDLAIDPQGYLHIVDSLNQCIFVFNINGDFIYSYGSVAVDEGALELPEGVYFDDDDFEVYIVDQGAKQVIVYGYGED